MCERDGRGTGRTVDCVIFCVCVCVCSCMQVCGLRESKREVNECPRETTLGDKGVVGGQAEEK